jgi:uncharacterized membrane protein
LELDGVACKAGDDILVSGNVNSITSGQALAGLGVRLELVDGDLAPIGDALLIITNSSGGFVGTIHIPDNLKAGTYYAKATVTIADTSYMNNSAGIAVETGAGEISLFITIGVVCVIAVAVILFVAWRRKGR